MPNPIRDRRPPRQVDTALDPHEAPITEPTPAPTPVAAVRTRKAPAPQPTPKSAPKATPTAPSDQIGYVTVNRTRYGNHAPIEAEARETVRVPVFGTAPARVRVSGSVTKNLGDFNSAKVEVSIDMPCLPEMSELHRVYEMLSAEVDDLCRRELALAIGDPNQIAPANEPPAPSLGPGTPIRMS